ncbi:glutathione S-transferase family protein [Myxococcota bacterium]|nr:glutathione S-transferase family protein [Myxococcota bacterium]
MKLFNSMGPNPRLVRMFLAEKELEIPFQEIDIMGGENRKSPYTDKNPLGQLPALELDDGSVIAETVAICEYIEEVHPSPAVIGANPAERAETRMWTRRVELNVTEPMGAGFRYSDGMAMFKDRIRVIPEAADGLKAQAQDGMARLNSMLEGKEFLTGSRFTLADIVLFSFLDFGKMIGQPVDSKNELLQAWMDRVAARPSAESSQ